MRLACSYIFPLLSVLAVSLMCAVLYPTLDSPDLRLISLLIILPTATTYGVLPALAASLASLTGQILLWDFELWSSKQQPITHWIFFTCVSFVTAWMGDRYRRASKTAREALANYERLVTTTDFTSKQEERAVLERVGDNLPDGAIYRVVTYADGLSKFTYMSAGIQRLLGVTADQVIANPSLLYDMMPPEDRRALMAAQDRARSELRIHECEFRQFTSSGDLKWFMCRAQPFPVEDGTVLWDGVVLDITNWKSVEESLRVSEERFRLAAKAVTGIVYDRDFSSGDIYFTDAMLDLVGNVPATREAAAAWWQARIHPDDIKRGFSEMDEALERGNGQFAVEYRVRHSNGNWITVCDRGHVVTSPANAHKRVVGCITDVSTARRMQDDLQESERRFRTLADAVPQLVWCNRPDGSFDYFNERWYAYTELPKDADGEWFVRECVHPDDRKRASNRWHVAVRHSNHFECELRIKRASTGEYRWFISRAVPVKDRDGQIVRWFGTCTDIDDQKRFLSEREDLLESERAARSEAERASRSKDQFVAVLSHELRAPLHAILGWIQMMKRGRLDEEQTAQAIEVVERNTRLQAQLISDLLDINRIVSGKLKLEMEPTDMREIVGAALQNLAPLAKAKGVTVTESESEFGDHSPLIMGDAGRLQQVVWNLLSNAVKFTPSGGTVSIEVSRIDSNIQVAVTDTGQGIESDVLPHVFERFRQAGKASVRKHGGLGLGLSIVKHLVELHGGSVSVESDGPDTGARFVLQVPMATRGEIEKRKEAPPREFESDLSGKKVFVLDDEPDSRLIVRRILTDAGAEVETAGSADEAIAALKSFAPDVIVSDIGMPGKDGYAFLKELRKSRSAFSSVPAIALTAFARGEDKARSLAAGFTVHLSKPIDANDLLVTVANASNGASRHALNEQAASLSI